MILGKDRFLLLGFLPFVLLLRTQLTLADGAKAAAIGSSSYDPGYTPYSFKDSLGRPDAAKTCGLTQLAINNPEYEKRCGEKSDPKWPCFTHYAGSLQYVRVEPWFDPLNMTEEVLIKDDKAVGTYWKISYEHIIENCRHLILLSRLFRSTSRLHAEECYQRDDDYLHWPRPREASILWI